MAKKSAIPKKVAGFKVPKAIRKSKPLRTMLGSKVGRDIIGKALIAGAAAAAAVLAEERQEVAEAGKKGARKGARAIGIAGEAMQSAAHAAMGVVTDHARSYLPQEKKADAAERKRGKDREDEASRPFASSATH